MGIAVSDDAAPVLKNTNALLAFNKKDAVIPEPTNCIRCGRCVEHCPLRLMPLYIETAYTLKKPELLEKYKVNVCHGVRLLRVHCPARRPLVQVMNFEAHAEEYQDKRRPKPKRKGKTGAKEKEKEEASAQ